MDRQQRIAARAYEIWERDGRQPGRDEENWHRATSEIDAEDAGSGGLVEKAEAAIAGAARGVISAATGAISAGIHAAADVVEGAIAPKRRRSKAASAEGEAPAATAPKEGVEKKPKIKAAAKPSPEAAETPKAPAIKAATKIEDKPARGRKRAGTTMH